MTLHKVIITSFHPNTYPLELLLQNTGDIKAEVRAKGQETIEEKYKESVVSWGQNKQRDKLDMKSPVSILKRTVSHNYILHLR